MRIQRLTSLDTPAPHPTARVAARATPTSVPELRRAISAAYAAETGSLPRGPLLDILTAHASHETGKGARMNNFNLGGIKGASHDGRSASYLTREVTSSGDVKTVQPFRAYRTLAEGARDYVSFLRGRYPAAVARAEAGDVEGFSHALKGAHYYTEAEPAYTAALRGLVAEKPGSGSSSAAPFGGSGDAQSLLRLPTSMQVAQVLDAVAAMSARIGAPLDGGDAAKISSFDDPAKEAPRWDVLESEGQ